MLWAVRLDHGIGNADLEALSAYVSPERAAKALRYVNALDAAETMLGEILVRLAAERNRLDGRRLRFAVNAYGKPLVPGARDFHFNVSHSRGLLACAVDKDEVGVDVEKLRLVEPDFALRCFSDGENRFLQGLSGSDWTESFFRIWCAKESFIKSVGLGLSLPLASFSAMPEGDFAVLTGVPECASRRIRYYPVGRFHTLALCQAGLNAPPGLVFLRYHEILDACRKCFGRKMNLEAH